MGSGEGEDRDPPSEAGQVPGGPLVPHVVAELRALAAKYLRKERKDHTLQPTELVHEAYLKLADQDERGWAGRTHFFAVASRAVRQVLVDHARKHKAAKRDQGRRQVTLHEGDASMITHTIDLLALDEALTEFEKFSPRKHRVIELRFFGGMRIEEISVVVGVAERTVKEDLKVARAWLNGRLKGKQP